MTTITVMNTNDSGAGSLRQAISDALPGYTIDFNVTGTITLTTGQLTINKNLIITGPPSPGITISGGNVTRVFDIQSGMVTLEYLTIADGNNISEFGGGGIINRSTATIRNCTLRNNTIGSASGGGISNTGTISILNCTLNNNTAIGTGCSGGAIGNSFGHAIVSNCTLSNNTSTDGSGIKNTATIDVKSTILYNTSISNSGTFTSNGYNLSNDGGSGLLTGTGDQINIDPMLGPLQDNGGPTFTHALLPGSPAINMGSNPLTLSFDQRGPGFPRTVGVQTDVGAFEVQAEVICVFPGALVYTTNGLKKIEDLRSGDIIFDDRGESVELINNIKCIQSAVGYTTFHKDCFAPNFPCADLIITDGHPIRFPNSDQEIPVEHLVNNQNIIRKIGPVPETYSLITKERIFIPINNIAVCTWAENRFSKYISRYNFVDYTLL